MESPINQNKNKSGNPLFQERIKSASMARRILPYRPLPAAETTSILSRLFGQEAATTDRVIYVHIPFCKHICPFCIYSKQIPESRLSNVAIDLIYMPEGQNMETWKRDLQLLASSPITGCSVYPLITLPGRSKISEDLKKEYSCFSEADSFLAELSGWQRFTPVQYDHSVNGERPCNSSDDWDENRQAVSSSQKYIWTERRLTTHARTAD